MACSQPSRSGREQGRAVAAEGLTDPEKDREAELSMAWLGSGSPSGNLLVSALTRECLGQKAGGGGYCHLKLTQGLTSQQDHKTFSKELCECGYRSTLFTRKQEAGVLSPPPLAFSTISEAVQSLFN